MNIDGVFLASYEQQNIALLYCGAVSMLFCKANKSILGRTLSTKVALLQVLQNLQGIHREGEQPWHLLCVHAYYTSKLLLQFNSWDPPATAAGNKWHRIAFVERKRNSLSGALLALALSPILPLALSQGCFQCHWHCRALGYLQPLA
jgi:hypothetical protein